MPPEHDGYLSVGQRIGLVETALIRQGEKIDQLEGWRDELRGAMALVKFTLGTSIVTGVIAVITLIGLVVNTLEHIP